MRPHHLVRDPDGRRLDDRRMADRRRLELGRADPLACDVQRVVRASVEEPVAVLVDRRPVAVRPDSGEPPPVRFEVPLRIAPDPRVIPGQGRLQTSSPTSPRTDRPRSSKTSTSSPSAGNPTEHALVGRIGVTERKHAPTSVPPEQFTIGIRPFPADVLVEPVVRPAVPGLAGGDDRAQRREVRDRLAVRMRARTSVGEMPSIVIRSLSTILQRRSGGRSGAPSMSTIVAPQAIPPTTVHGPMIQPMSVEKSTRSPRLRSAWYAVSRTREEATVDVERALRATGRPGRVRDEIRRLAFDLCRGKSPGFVGDDLVPPHVAAARHRAVHSRSPPDDDVLDRRRIGESGIEDFLHGYESPTAVRRIGRQHDLRGGVCEPRRDRRSREPREDRYLNGADVRTRARRRPPPVPSAGRFQPRRPPTRRAGEAPRQAVVPRARARTTWSDRLSPSSGTHTAASWPGRSRAQRCTPSAMFRRAPRNHVVHSIPCDSSSTSPQSRERDAEIACDGAPEPIASIETRCSSP